tara:strand:+ start:522 stop:635 length:114 start_codon:yes stop_codon:yes gene_type:complete
MDTFTIRMKKAMQNMDPINIAVFDAKLNESKDKAYKM